MYEALIQSTHEPLMIEGDDMPGEIEVLVDLGVIVKSEYAGQMFREGPVANTFHIVRPFTMSVVAELLGLVAE